MKVGKVKQILVNHFLEFVCDFYYYIEVNRTTECLDGMASLIDFVRN